MNYPHSPLPGNPTPPITPGAVQPPYPGQMPIKKGIVPIDYVELGKLQDHVVVLDLRQNLFMNKTLNVEKAKNFKVASNFSQLFYLHEISVIHIY